MMRPLFREAPRSLSASVTPLSIDQLTIVDDADYPKAVRTDQGPEFTSRAFLAWATARYVRHILNQAGKPTQNAYIESFNGKFRDECLNEHWFETLPQAESAVPVVPVADPPGDLRDLLRHARDVPSPMSTRRSISSQCVQRDGVLAAAGPFESIFPGRE